MPAPRPLTPSQLSRYARYSTWPSIDESTFAHGLVTDMSPINLPPGAVPDATNFLFDRPGMAHKRGGTSYQSNTLGTPPGAPLTSQVLWADFTAGSKLIAVAFETGTGQNRIFDATGSSSINAGASGAVPAEATPPVLYNDAVIQVGGFAPKKITNVSGTLTVGSWGGSPPQAYYAVNHGGYLILANTDANPNRLWFSPIPDPEAAWDTSNAYIDTATAITGLASVQGVLLVFHFGSTERVIGAIPPGTVGENMALQPVSAHAGCVDSRTIQKLGSNIVFADQNGIWVTNGAGVNSISTKPNGMGIAKSWRASLTSLVPGATLVGGTYGSDFYFAGFVSAAASTNVLYVYHFPTGNWSKLKGVSITMTTTKSFGLAETFAAASNENRVLKLSDCFAWPPTNKADAAGTAITCSLTTRDLSNGPGLKAYGHGWVTYDMRDAASDNPSLAVTVLRGIEQDASKTPAESPFVETTTAARKRFAANFDSQSAAVKLDQTNASSRTDIYGIEIQVRPYGEQSEVEG